MKLLLASSLTSLACAFSPSTSIRNGVAPLSMLPKEKLQNEAFFPFESSTSLNAKKETDDSGIRQLLGVRGAAQETNIWKIRLQLTKPVTWIPLVWGVMCGAAASGNYHWIWNPFDPNDRDVMLGLEDTAKAITAMILAGPFLTGYTQTINDWYDRDIDAINEPNRPIPSGAIGEKDVIAQIWVLLIGGLVLSYGLDVWCEHEFPINLALAVFGSFISYIYSAPPLKLKQNGWAGNFALGASYISLPWWCGQAVFGEIDRPVFWIL
jgi:chlorophyll synthase